MQRDARGFGLVEALVSLTVFVFVLSGLAGLMLHHARVNRSVQLVAEVQANARASLALIVQTLHSAGWDPSLAGVPTVVTDPDPGDDVSQIEVFADLDGDGATDKDGEQILIRHVADRVEWRRAPDAPFAVVAANVVNDADGDGTPEPMFVPFPALEPEVVRVQLTARSATVDPRTGEFVRYTVSSDVALRKNL